MKKYLVLALLLLASGTAYGQILTNQPLSSLVEYSFTTRSLSGTPTNVVGGTTGCTKGSNGGTISTAGQVFVTSFNGTAGTNHLTVDLTADTMFYSANAQIACWFTAGTVGGSSIAGELIFQFQISSDLTVQKGVQFANFPIWMLQANGNAVTGLTPSCTVQKDSGAFATSANTAVEVGSGRYRLTLTSSETNANVLSVVCTGGNAVPYRTNVTPQQ